MHFNKRSCEPNSKYIPITKEIANKFLSCLNNPAIFKAKLSRVYINLFNLPVKNIFGCTRNSQLKSTILVTYNANTMSEKHIAFCIAHEFAHMLMYDLTDRLSFFDKKISYTTPNGIVTYENTSFQLKLEEAMADHLALFIVSQLNYDDSNHSFEKYLTSENQIQKGKLISAIEAKYGTPLMQCKMIDEFEVIDNHITIANALWYDCVTHALNLKLN